MAAERVERRLAAILAADVAGYSRLMGADEEGTLARLTGHRRELFDPAIAKYRGRIVKTAGDGLLAEFASVVDAVRCAAEVQAGMAERNLGAPESRRLDFRIGINVGDIVEQDSDIFGDGVNIAARLESIAEPGGICVSQRVQEDAAGKAGMSFDDMGEQTLKNIARPVRAYRVRIGKANAMAAQPLTASGEILPLPDKPSIAILPFQNMSGDPEQEYFSDGLTEDIITALSKLRGFFVISRNSTFAYKAKAPDVRQVARDLGVRYVLEGSVRKAGERLRITGQLIDAATGAHVWAERYDRALADIFAVQDEITQNVVAAIEPQVYAAENVRLQTKPPESLDAWGYVMRAMPHVWTWASPDDNAIAQELLGRAIKLDPLYSRANSLLAWTHAATFQGGRADAEQERDRAYAFARRAIERDPEDAWPHLALGYVHMVSRRSKSAVVELSDAIDRNPSFALAHMILSSTYGYAGESEKALAEAGIAARLAPRDFIQSAIYSVTGTAYFSAGRYAEAADNQRRAVELAPHFTTAWRSLASMAGLAGDLELAASALTETLRLQPNLTIDWVEKYHPLVRAEDRALYAKGLANAGLK
jgi:TolB-like protein/class 3 adenylate cyclase/Tfp pilus assembly protein PilF